MNCVQLHRSLVDIDDASSSEQQAHLKACPACLTLVTELKLISAAAVELQLTDEPSPRVWNSIEIALRREGLIRPQRNSRSLMPSFGTRWSWARWLAPAAAILLITAGIYVRKSSTPVQVADNASTQAVPPISASQGANVNDGMSDDDLRQEIADQSPVLQAQYEQNLQRVNESIRDAEGDVQANPNDDEARRSLVEAYQQKAMLFEMAMDRAVP